MYIRNSLTSLFSIKQKQKRKRNVNAFVHSIHNSYWNCSSYSRTKRLSEEEYMNKIKETTYGLFSLFTTLNACDVIVTHQAISSGVAREGNPVMNKLLLINPVATIVFKVVIVPIFLFALLQLVYKLQSSKRYEYCMLIVYLFIVVEYLYVWINNLSLL